MSRSLCTAIMLVVALCVPVVAVTRQSSPAINPATQRTTGQAKTKRPTPWSSRRQLSRRMLIHPMGTHPALPERWAVRFSKR
jgi:hypothetical protein